MTIEELEARLREVATEICTEGKRPEAANRLTYTYLGLAISEGLQFDSERPPEQPLPPPVRVKAKRGRSYERPEFYIEEEGAPI